jgi:1-acyl-sn-glycerol-3-phosphate acyltransferase
MGNGNVMEENRFFYLLKYLGAYPVYPQNPVPALDYTMKLLEENLAVLIAPQGKRIPSTPLDDYHNLINEAKTGVGRVVLRSNGKVPVVPLYIHGSYEALSFGKAIPKLKSFISISFCRPLIFSKYTRKEEWNELDLDFHSNAKKISKTIMASIRDQMLIEEQYFFQILNKKAKKSIEELNLSHRTHPKVYKFLRNLLRYSPSELKHWIESL